MEMGHNFSQVPRADIPRSVFNRSHGYKSTFNAGLLIPFYVDEALPGDTFELNVSMFARLATLLQPIMDNLYLECFFFSVPNRLLWTNWQRFMGERDPDPNSSIDYLVPILDFSQNPPGLESLSIFDYMGCPVLGNAGNVQISALPFRAYNLIWNEWFRDQNLQDSVPKNMGNGPDLEGDYVLKRRGKRHDYFTSCLPWPQKGTAVELPIGDSAPIVVTGDGEPTFTAGAGSTVTPLYTTVTAGAPIYHQGTLDAAGNLQWEDPKLEADLSNATASTINALREAFQIQRLLERDARGGTRYVEILRSHFGVVSPDARLQRPEYLGGGRIPVGIRQVEQTAPTSGTEHKASLAGYGQAAGGGIGFVKSFVEHCTLIGLVMARADINYQSGLKRMFSRRTRYDFYWPAFAHLGEQAVLEKELFCQGTADDSMVFGYQERWAEYRYAQNMVTGLLRSGVANSLDVWHLAQEFGGRPDLNGTFIEEDPPMARVLVVDEPHFIFDSHFNVRCTRPMPMFSVPGLMDHF